MLFSPTPVLLLLFLFFQFLSPPPPHPPSELQVGHGFPNLLVDNTDEWRSAPPLHDVWHTVRPLLGTGGGRGDIRHPIRRARRRGRDVVVAHRADLLRVGGVRVRGARQIDIRGVLRVRDAHGRVDRDVDIFEAATTTTTCDDDDEQREGYGGGWWRGVGAGGGREESYEAGDDDGIDGRGRRGGQETDDTYQ